MPARPSPLNQAVLDGDLAEVERLLAAGEPANGPPGAAETPLHLAAERGPLALVERLIAAGAIEWMPDHNDRTPLARARAGAAAEREAIVELLDRPVIRDPSFRAAVTAIQTGNLGALERLLDAEPRLLRERIMEPECYRQAQRGQYFRDPKLFWFVADNPNLIETMPANTVEIASAMIERGVEQDDLDYTLGLVMTSRPAREQGLQIPLLMLLKQAGGRPGGLDGALAHRELDAVRALVEAGEPVTLAIAAGLGLDADVAALLPDSTADERQMALAHAALNGQTEAARLILEAGAELNAPTPVHSHATPLHHAALYDYPELVTLFLAHGADPTARDTLWNGTPLGWAHHGGAQRARAILEAL